jgi:hypothetical protein
VRCGFCSWARFFNLSRFAKVAGNTIEPSASASPPSRTAEPLAASFQAQSPVTGSSSSTNSPAFVGKRLFS